MSEIFYQQTVHSPLGPLTLVATEKALLGAWFEGQKYELRGFENCAMRREQTAVLEAAMHWLEAYFSGEELPSLPPLAAKGTTFQERVWQELLTIPLGQTRTYGQLAQALGSKSAQAVGGAVGKNPLSIFVPCHRVLGSDGSLTGYAGGLEKKSWLLDHERRGGK